MKLFIKRPTAGADLVPKVLKWATEDVDNPDLRDRGYIYWRLLSTDPAAAKDIVMLEKPAISTESEGIDRAVLDRLLLQTGTLSSVYHRQCAPPFLLQNSLQLMRTATNSPEAFIRGVKPKNLYDSPALNQAAKESYRESMRMAARKPPPVPRTSTVPKPPPKPASAATIDLPPSHPAGTGTSDYPILGGRARKGTLDGENTVSLLGASTNTNGSGAGGLSSFVEEPESMGAGDLSASGVDGGVVSGAGATYDPYAGLDALDGGFMAMGLGGSANGYTTDAPAPLRGMTGAL